MTESKKKITIRPNGAYKVEGGVPLVRKVQVVSDEGEPLTWQKTTEIPTGETYSLCRCGKSAELPFCDGTHKHIGFDGTETADTRPTAERQETLPNGKHIVVHQDFSLCMNSGFCANRKTDIAGMMPYTEEGSVRAEMMAMIERCPSGSLVYSLTEKGENIEPDLPQQIALTTEITDGGPIEGPLWVTGGIEIERSDGKPFETRNRVTLCNCGHSRNKPLCDGTHRAMAEEKTD